MTQVPDDPPKSSEELNARINALPDWLRKYIHDIETKCDPAGDIRNLAEARMQIAALLRKLCGKNG